MQRICYYHAGCPDGFGAAFSVWSAWGDDARYVARGHDDRLRAKDVSDCHIAFVDIAPDNEELVELADSARRVTVLDHHVTSMERFAKDQELGSQLSHEGHEIHFDMGHSGAMLAWRHFHPDTPAPDLLRYVEDQDLWNWALPRSREVNARIGVETHDFEAWRQMAERPWEELAREGEPLVRSQRMEVERAVQNATPIAIGSRRFEAVNATTQRADIGHALSERARFGEAWGCVYRLIGDRVHATLYSIGEVDVGSIARELGGGGHKNAAGFSVPLSRWLEEFLY